MTATYDPALCERLRREAREDDERMTQGEWIGGADCVVIYKDKHERFAGTVIAEMVEPDRHEDNAAGIARARNNLRAMADQLEASGREIERLAKDRDSIASGVRTGMATLIAERDLMRPVVESAEWWVDQGPVRAGIRAAVDAYRAAKAKAGG